MGMLCMVMQAIINSLERLAESCYYYVIIITYYYISFFYKQLGSGLSPESCLYKLKHYFVNPLILLYSALVNKQILPCNFTKKDFVEVVLFEKN